MRESDESLPTAPESLAAICKFLVVKMTDQDFHAHHWQPIAMAAVFVGDVLDRHPSLEHSLTKAIQTPLAEGAASIQSAIDKESMTADEIDAIDARMTDALRALVPVVRDPELPRWLRNCRWAIEGAFDPAQLPRVESGSASSGSGSSGRQIH